MVSPTSRLPRCKRCSSKCHLFSSNVFESTVFINRKNFHDGWEREGAAIAVYYKGELVVDLHGGYADASALRKWTPDTRTVVFSATKVGRSGANTGRSIRSLSFALQAVAALCVGILVDRGHLAYEDLVSKYWPEFAQNGKENITVEWIMTHKVSGFAMFETSTLVNHITHATTSYQSLSASNDASICRRDYRR